MKRHPKILKNGSKNLHVSKSQDPCALTHHGGLEADKRAHNSTGITGYIAGDAFVAIYEKHPDYEYTALVRSEDHAKKITEKYPSVKVVLGNLDSYDLLKKEAAKADIVLRKLCSVC